MRQKMPFLQGAHTSYMLCEMLPLYMHILMCDSITSMRNIQFICAQSYISMYRAVYAMYALLGRAMKTSLVAQILQRQALKGGRNSTQLCLGHYCFFLHCKRSNGATALFDASIVLFLLKILPFAITCFSHFYGAV